MRPVYAGAPLLGRLCWGVCAWHAVLMGFCVGIVWGGGLSGSNRPSVDNWPLVRSSSREAKLAQTAETCQCVVCLPLSLVCATL